MTFRFLHLADLHLDSAYGGRPATRARLRLASMEALESAVSFAIRGELDAVLIAGDAFDDGRLGYDARALLRREVARLRCAGVSVVYATGNHDPGGAAFAAAGLRLDALEEPGARVAPVHVALDPAPQTWTLRRAGSPIATVTACGHDTTAVAANLAATMHPPETSSLPHVAVLHTQVGSAKGADGHARYAPSSGADLQRAGFAYWALGHVHVRGRADRSAPAWYSGNLQGRSSREDGPKGGLVVEVDRRGPVRPPEFVAFAPVEFLCVGIDAAELATPGSADVEPEDLAAALHGALVRSLAAREGVAPPREAVVRVDLHGTLPGPLSAALEDPSMRPSIEDAVRDDPRLAGLGVQLHEIQLRASAEADTGLESPSGRADHLDALERSLLASPSALREALRLVGELEGDPSVADGWDIDWTERTRPSDARSIADRRARVAALARGLRTDFLTRARRSASTTR